MNAKNHKGGTVGRKNKKPPTAATIRMAREYFQFGRTHGLQKHTLDRFAYVKDTGRLYYGMTKWKTVCGMAHSLSEQDKEAMSLAEKFDGTTMFAGQVKDGYEMYWLPNQLSKKATYQHLGDIWVNLELSKQFKARTFC